MGTRSTRSRARPEARSSSGLLCRQSSPNRGRTALGTSPVQATAGNRGWCRNSNPLRSGLSIRGCGGTARRGAAWRSWFVPSAPGAGKLGHGSWLRPAHRRWALEGPEGAAMPGQLLFPACMVRVVLQEWEVRDLRQDSSCWLRMYEHHVTTDSLEKHRGFSHRVGRLTDSPTDGERRIGSVRGPGRRAALCLTRFAQASTYHPSPFRPRLSSLTSGAPNEPRRWLPKEVQRNGK